VTDTGSAVSVTLPNLAPAATYYFAATTYTASGLESDFSAEASYTVPPASQSPTLDPLNNLTINEGSGNQTVSLTGIGSGIANQSLVLTVSAFSSDVGLIPNPIVEYTSPDTQGTLTFAPLPGSFGSAVLTVMVDNGQSTSNTVIRSFTVTVLPVNMPPTLNLVPNLVLNENAGPQTVSLSGISSGSPNEVQTLMVTASSSNPSLIPNPVVSYTSPNPTGTLSFTPVTNNFGSATITVSVNDGQITNGTTSVSFTITVNQTGAVQTTLTNATVLPNSVFRFVLNPPYTNGDHFSYSLGSDAPAGASIVTRKGISSVVWVPSSSQASTTNLFTIIVTDKTTRSLSTNEPILVVVLDYLSVGGGSTSVQAGQPASVPIYLSASDGVTNVTFTVDWPSSRFLNPSLAVVAPASSASSLQNQTTNLLINLQSLPSQAISGSNLIAQLSFLTTTNQTSAFVNLPVKILNASKPNATSYAYTRTAAEQIVVVNDTPLIEASSSTNFNRNLTLFGKIGTRFQLQYSTNLSLASWYGLLNYTQTNLAQSVSVDGNIPLIFYRLLQQ